MCKYSYGVNHFVATKVNYYNYINKNITTINQYYPQNTTFIVFLYKTRPTLGVGSKLRRYSQNPSMAMICAM